MNYYYYYSNHSYQLSYVIIITLLISHDNLKDLHESLSLESNFKFSKRNAKSTRGTEVRQHCCAEDFIKIPKMPNIFIIFNLI